MQIPGFIFGFIPRVVRGLLESSSESCARKAYYLTLLLNVGRSVLRAEEIAPLEERVRSLAFAAAHGGVATSLDSEREFYRAVIVKDKTLSSKCVRWGQLCLGPNLEYGPQGAIFVSVGTSIFFALVCLYMLVTYGEKVLAMTIEGGAAGLLLVVGFLGLAVSVASFCFVFKYRKPLGEVRCKLIASKRA